MYMEWRQDHKITLCTVKVGIIVNNIPKVTRYSMGSLYFLALQPVK